MRDRLLITDAQVHVWLPDRDLERSRGLRTHRPDGFSVEQLIAEMDCTGVDRAVLIPATLWSRSASEYALAAVRNHPDRFLVVDHFDPGAPTARQKIETLRDEEVPGIRLLLRTNPYWLDDGSIDWLWSACERLDLPIMLFVGGMAGKIDAIAGRYPGLKLIVDHMDRIPRERGADAFGTIDALLRLSKHANVFVKMTAAPGCSSEPYPFRDIYSFLKAIYEAFGPQRLMWGSDLSGLECTYKQCLEHFTEELDFLSKEDKDWILGKTSSAILKWPQTRTYL